MPVKQLKISADSDNSCIESNLIYYRLRIETGKQHLLNLVKKNFLKINQKNPYTDS